MTVASKQKERPTYVLDLDTILDWVDLMLDHLEEALNERDYQNCITVLNHLIECDEMVYGSLQPSKGVSLGNPVPRYDHEPVDDGGRVEPEELR